MSSGPRPLDEDIWTVGGLLSGGVVLGNGMWYTFECIVHVKSSYGKNDVVVCRDSLLEQGFPDNLVS